MRRIIEAAPLFLFFSATMMLVVDGNGLTGSPVKNQQTWKILTRMRREPNIQAYGLPLKVLSSNGRIETIRLERKSGFDGKVNKIHVIEDSEILTYDVPTRHLQDKNDHVDRSSILDESRERKRDNRDLPELLTITTSKFRRPRCSGLCSFTGSRWPIDTGSTAEEIQRIALIGTELRDRGRESDKRPESR